MTKQLAAAVALLFDAHFAAAAGEEKVIQDDLVKNLCQLLHDAQVFGPVIRIGIAEGVIIGGLADAVHKLGGGDAAGNLDTVFFKHSLGHAQLFLRNINFAPVVFDIHLVQMDVLFVKIYALLNVFFFSSIQIIGKHIRRHLKVFKLLEAFHYIVPLTAISYLMIRL